MLHIISKSPFNHNAFETCLRLASPNCDILLIEDGIFALISPLLITALKQHEFYALRSDLQARGMLTQVHHKITVIDYHGFVDLTVKHPKIQTW